MTKMEERHVQLMINVYRQYILSDSWKRRNDLKRQLSRLEKDWEEYKKHKKGDCYGNKNGINHGYCAV